MRFRVTFNTESGFGIDRVRTFSASSRRALTQRLERVSNFYGVPKEIVNVETGHVERVNWEKRAR